MAGINIVSLQHKCYEEVHIKCKPLILQQKVSTSSVMLLKNLLLLQLMLTSLLNHVYRLLKLLKRNQFIKKDNLSQKIKP